MNGVQHIYIYVYILKFINITRLCDTEKLPPDGAAPVRKSNDHQQGVPSQPTCREVHTRLPMWIRSVDATYSRLQYASR